MNGSHEPTVKRDETRPEMSRRSFLARGSAFTFAAAVTGPGLTILSGCGGGSSSSGPLTFMQFYGPGGEVEVQGRWFEEMVAAWNDENERKIELQYIPTPQYVNGSRLQTAFSSGEGPDIFIISPGDFLRYYNGGVLQDLSQYMDQAAIDDFYPASLTTRTVDGKVYALPMEVEPLAMYYSVRAFEQAGLSEADIPSTWDDLLNVADRLTTDDRFGVLFDTNPGYYQNFTWYPFMWQGGGDAVADGESAFDSEGAVQALSFWQDAVQADVAPRTTQGVGGQDLVANVASGYCAMQQSGIWGVAALRENSPDFDYGVFPLPTPEGGEYTTDLGGWAFVANSEGKDPETAGRFCVWALGSMEEGSIGRGLQWISEADSTIAPRKSVQEAADRDGVFDSGPLRVFQQDAFPGARAEPRYPPEIYRAVSDALQACQLDGADPREQAERASESITSFLEGYSGAAIT